MIGRRKFLYNCGALITALGLSPTVFLAGCQDESEAGLEVSGQDGSGDFSTREKYSAFLNELYNFNDSEQQLETLAELISVEEMPVVLSVEQKNIEKFSLVFKSRLGSTELPAGMYNVSNENLGEFQLYIEPVEGSDDGVYYTADFCLLLGFDYSNYL